MALVVKKDIIFSDGILDCGKILILNNRTIGTMDIVAKVNKVSIFRGVVTVDFSLHDPSDSIISSMSNSFDVVDGEKVDFQWAYEKLKSTEMFSECKDL